MTRLPILLVAALLLSGCAATVTPQPPPPPVPPPVPPVCDDPTNPRCRQPDVTPPPATYRPHRAAHHRVLHRTHRSHTTSGGTAKPVVVPADKRSP